MMELTEKEREQILAQRDAERQRAQRIQRARVILSSLSDKLALQIAEQLVGRGRGPTQIWVDL